MTELRAPARDRGGHCEGQTAGVRSGGMSDPHLEAEARRRLGARRAFVRTMILFVILAIVLIAIWALTGRNEYFWPIWPIGALAVAALFMALDAFGLGRRELQQSDVDAEIERMKRRR